MKFYYATNIFDLQIFDNEKTTYILKFAQNPFFSQSKKCYNLFFDDRMRFFFFKFSKWKKY